MPATVNNKPLRLKADDAAGLAVISACLQDAIASVGDMRYQPTLRRFALVVTRFRWENAQSLRQGGQRVRCGVHFDNVLAVQSRDIDMGDPGGLLPLLAVECEPAGDDVAIRLEFAGGGELRLRAEYVDCRLSDIGESWPTPNRPDHDTGAA